MTIIVEKLLSTQCSMLDDIRTELRRQNELLLEMITGTKPKRKDV